MVITAKKTRPRRQVLAIVLFIAQLLVAIAGLIASWFNVESILATGPLLVVVGLSLAVAVRPLGTWTPLLFGLSGPLISALVAFIIAAFRLGPPDAVWPVITIFAIYLIVLAALATFAIGQIRQWPHRSSQLRVWRYSIKSLLGLMTIVAILTAVLASVAKAFYYFPVAFAAFGSVAIVLAGVVVWRFAIQRRRMPHPSTPANESAGKM
jgi:hypothetical protein